uniref:Uncharacterized protein n=1 Tax=Parascaris equorum TaxID=6256 RepID=A0A914R5N8_PAREQ
MEEVESAVLPAHRSIDSLIQRNGKLFSHVFPLFLMECRSVVDCINLTFIIRWRSGSSANRPRCVVIYKKGATI